MKTPFKESYSVFNPSKTKKLFDVVCDYPNSRASISLDSNFVTEDIEYLIICLDELKTVGIKRWMLTFPDKDPKKKGGVSEVIRV